MNRRSRPLSGFWNAHRACRGRRNTRHYEPAKPLAVFSDSYVTHGGTIEELWKKISDVNARRERRRGAAICSIGMSAYVIIRDIEAEAYAKFERITTIDTGSPGYVSLETFSKHSNLDV